MYNLNLYTKDLYVYRGSTFDGSICLEDIHGEPFCISEGDEIILYIEKAIKNPEQSDPFTLTLNNRDEVCGRYPFKLEPEITEAFSGDYYYYIYIRFADGDYYQIVPYTPLHACIPYGVINYCENKNLIRARVPRVMAKSGYEPAINEIMEMITNSESGDITESVQIKHIKEADIIVIKNNSDIISLTPSGLVGYIKNAIDYSGAENPYITGFFNSNVNTYQKDFKSAVKEAFPDKYIDIEDILKTPVLSESSSIIVSSIALDILRQKATNDDIISITQGKYPVCMLKDKAVFNEKGCYAAAKTLIKEVFNNNEI